MPANESIDSDFKINRLTRQNMANRSTDTQVGCLDFQQFGCKDKNLVKIANQGKVQGSTAVAQILWSGGVWPPNESVNSLMNGFSRECSSQWEGTQRNWIPGQEGARAPSAADH